MNISQLEFNKLSYTQMTNLLFTDIKDNNEFGDCIMVVGSRSAVRYRLPKAIELYRQGRSSKILFSGGAKFEGSELAEAIQLKNEAVALGVPEKDILIEDISLNTLENVLASLLILDRAFHLFNIKRLLVVTNSYHMRRLYLTLKTYMPGWIKFTLCPTQDGVTSKDNWFQSEKGRIRVQTEVEKIIKYVKQGALVDEEYEFLI
ncbi:hypothetical protein ACA30_18510 [Virgibacillus soli]|uniref:DUF218 domain-containing protein n=1 Tax=Lederbergia galactosidilytica TaxID=217031 RepID=A0A0Q9Y948_9BACI|nr:YdcF family protein [Lederbergia galactosidilytica]KRG12604.1 hypothetical protein ACA30_18510 [Virgibacillus soli]KRG13636.1 hypothetical protein ACA29_08120 [Lederbergia galactosidilytica]MBP1916085.1 uncharacterized SAM-binding protein YcdF (DUF218 family) [Lederbergia galactosidilytica]